jgi:hypothetical protein
VKQFLYGIILYKKQNGGVNMSYIRKITNSEELSKIIDLPDDLKNKKVEVIILPYEENTKTKKSHKSLQGSLKKYKNQELINEENTAWEKMVKDKYENS